MTTRQTMGTSASQATVAYPDPAHTHAVPKTNGRSLAPDSVGGHRSQTMERLGFKGAPQVNYVYPNAGESGQTYRNVRIMPPSRGNQGFYEKRAYGQSPDFG